MKLRSRLLAGVLGAAVPVAAIATAVQLRWERTRSAELVREHALARLEDVGQAACESDPAAFGGLTSQKADTDWLSDEGDAAPEAPRLAGRSSVRLRVFDSAFVAAGPEGRSLPVSARRELAQGEPFAVFVAGSQAQGGVRENVAFRTPWISRTCAYAVVDRPVPKRAGWLERTWPVLLVTMAVVMAVLAAAGPLVARIGRLTKAVRVGATRELEHERTDEIAELARAFDERERTIARQLGDIEAREAALREHLATTSHDILLPVTNLRWHLVAIEENATSGGLPRTESVRRALEETDYIASLVRDLNAETRLRAGLRSMRAEVDLAEIVERVASRHRPLATRSRISLEVATPPLPVRLVADPSLLEQMVSNVVHNAVRYASDAGHVAVVLDARDGRFSLDVLDDGSGVPEHVLSRLCERGFRTDEARARRPEGTGLGLYIVEAAANAHGFTLELSNLEPTGFRVRIAGASHAHAA